MSGPLSGNTTAYWFGRARFGAGALRFRGTAAIAHVLCLSINLIHCGNDNDNEFRNSVPTAHGPNRGHEQELQRRQQQQSINSTQRALPAVKQTERKREKGRQAQYRSTQNRTAESRGRVPPKPIRRGVPAQRSRHQESASALPTPSYPHPTPHTALSSSVQFSSDKTRAPASVRARRVVVSMDE